MAQVEVNVAGHVKVEVSVVVIVAEGGTGAPHQLLAGDSRLGGHVGEGAVAIIPVENVRAVVVNKKIDEAMVETFGGKSVRCKLKPLKNAKLEGKGVIQIPEKIQQMLNVGKGELVRVKPVIE